MGAIGNRKGSQRKKFPLDILSRTYFPYWLLVPSLLIIFGVVIYPLVYSFFLSLHRVYLNEPGIAPFVGFRNYGELLLDSFFWNTIGRTLFFSVLSVTGAFAIGLGIALVLNREFRYRGIVRALILIPWALPSVVVGITWRWIYNADYGALNGLLLNFGLIDSYRSWLGNPSTALYMIVITKIWKEVPFVALILLAGLQTIPKSLYEAAKIDGSDFWRCFRYITLPLLRPSILVVLVLQTMWSIRVFDIIYVMTRGGPANKTMVITYYTFLRTFKFLDFGHGTALAYIVTMFIVVLTLIYIKLLYVKIEY